MEGFKDSRIQRFKGLWLVVMLVVMFFEVNCAKKGMIKESGVTIKDKEVKVEIEDMWIQDWNALVYKEPEYNTSIVTMVNRGEKIRIEKQKGEWCKVKVGNKEGWIKREVTSETQVKGIKIESVKLSKKERIEVRKYIEEAERLLKSQDSDWEKLEKEYQDGKVGYDEYVNGQREITSYPTKAYYLYKKAYEIDANNLEAMKGIIIAKSEMTDPTPGSEGIDREKLKPDSIYLCNRALLLNPPDKEWWLWKLGKLYENKNKNISKILYEEYINISEKEHTYNSEYFFVLLRRLYIWTNDLNKKKYYLNKILVNLDKCADCDDKYSIITDTKYYLNELRKER